MKILLTQPEVGEALSCCARTVSAIPEAFLPKIYMGRALRYRRVDVESLAERLAKGEIKIGRVNGGKK